MSRHIGVLGPLGRRLLVAFAAVSLGAVGLVAALSVLAVQAQTSGLEAGQRDRAERAIVQALADAYGRAGTWSGADLTTARALAQAAGLQVVVLNATGGPVARLDPTPEPVLREPEPPATAPSSTGPAPTTGPPAPTSSTPRRASPTSSSSPGERQSPSSGSSVQPVQPGQSGRSVQPGPSPGSSSGRATATNAGGLDAGGLDAGGPDAGGPEVGGGGPQVVAVVAVRTQLAAEATSATTSPPAASVHTLPILVGGVSVGNALIEPAAAAPGATQAARAAILQTIGWAGLAAIAATLLVSFLVARRITRPLAALVSAAQAVERGDPDAGQLLRPGPGELGDVATAFAQMATTVRRSDQVRRAMAADVAHELRTPVTILRGGTEELLDGLAPITREAVESLHEEVLRLERLVEDLATLSAAEAAGLSLRLAPVDVGALVRRTVAQLRTQLAEADLTATVTVAEDGGPPLVSGDDTRLTQVVTNLLTNAIAYAPSGGRILVEVRCRGDQVAVAVSDTGPGIPTNALPHVFERFYRAPTASGRQGTGIGLAVVAELVAAHGGEVEAASPPGRWALFTVTLPRR